MFPALTLFGAIKIYTFGLALAVSFFLFFALAARLSRKLALNEHFFPANALWIVLSIFFWARLWYIFAHFSDLGSVFTQWFWHFLLLSGYDFSIVGALGALTLLLYFRIRQFALPGYKMLDIITLSLLLAGVAGYIGAFLGGQVYGVPTDLPIGVTYTSSDANVPFIRPIIPLALFYALFCGVQLAILYVFRRISSVDGLSGMLALILSGSMILVWDFYSGNLDSWKEIFGVSFPQIAALALIWYGIYGFKQLYRKN